jgi:hypothetical protein
MKQYTFNIDAFTEGWIFSSEYDDGYRRCTMTIKEENYKLFVAEQVAKFTAELLSALEVEENVDFAHVELETFYDEDYEEYYFECPDCGEMIYETKWKEEGCCDCGFTVMKEDY